MYSLPSTSKMRDPAPRSMNLGVPPTFRKARTGEFTPPGIDSCARANKVSDLAVFMVGYDRLHRFACRDQLVQEQIHDDLVHRSVEVFEQAALQAKVRL